MKDSILLKENIKDKIIENFSEIKNQSRSHRLYNFILNRIDDSNLLFLPVSGTLKNLKDKIEDNNYNYPAFWSANEMNLTCENHEPLKQDILQKLNLLSPKEIDLLLIESLKELKQDDFFINEIPEFSIYIQNAENNIQIDEYSFKIINGNTYWDQFKNRKLNNEISLTNLLVDKYNLR